MDNELISPLSCERKGQVIFDLSPVSGAVISVVTLSVYTFPLVDDFDTSLVDDLFKNNVAKGKFAQDANFLVLV